MSNLRFATVLLGIAALQGCRADEVGREEQVASDRSDIVDGTPEAYGVLELLNETDLHVLDALVPLDRRAAEHLIAHRDGADAARGTHDDDPFDGIAEVDAVSYVGPATIERLVAYADAEGYVPHDGDVLGVFDNVAFTVDEAEATLELVNSAVESVLDDDVGLDSRAVESIMQARAIESLLELSGLYYVGQSTMLKLRDFTKPGGTTPEGYPCDAHDECQSGLCAGLQVPFSDGHGWCMEAWMADTFSSTDDVAIGDDGSAATSTIEVSGLATVPLDVIIDLDIDHPHPEHLVVQLHQPGGATAVLWSHEANPPTHFATPPGLEGDNMVNGEWILEITDTVSGSSGTLRGWSMWISSNWD